MPNRTNFLTSFISKGGSPLTGEDIICSYIDALSELKKRAPHVRQYCFLRAMYFEKSEIDLINLDERSLSQFIKNLNVGDSDLSIKYKYKWSKEKNIKKVSRKVVSKHVVYNREIKYIDDKSKEKFVKEYDEDIRKICGKFYKKFTQIDWGTFHQEALTKLIELLVDPLLDLKKLSDRGYVLVSINNRLSDVVREEHKHHKNTSSLDKLLEELEQDSEEE